MEPHLNWPVRNEMWVVVLLMPHVIICSNDREDWSHFTTCEWQSTKEPVIGIHLRSYCHQYLPLTARHKVNTLMTLRSTRQGHILLDNVVPCETFDSFAKSTVTLLVKYVLERPRNCESRWCINGCIINLFYILKMLTLFNQSTLNQQLIICL